MKKEESAGIIIFHDKKYLLLNYPKTTRAPKEYWGLVKGHVEKGETAEEAAKREVKEETGIVAGIIDGFMEKITYHFRFNGELIEKSVIFFVGLSETDKVVLSHEHKGFGWFEFEEAVKKLSYDNDKDVLRKAHEFLNN